MGHTLYRVEGRPGLPAFNTFQARLVLFIAELMASEDPEGLIVVEGARATEDMLQTWREYKTRIVAVEGDEHGRIL